MSRTLQVAALMLVVLAVLLAATPVRADATPPPGAASQSGGRRDGGGDGPHHDTRHVPDLALLTYNDARAAEGHRGLFLVKTWSVRVKGVHWVCQTLSPDDALRTAYIPFGKPWAASAPMVVEAEMRLVWHPRSEDGAFPGHWEYRLWDAVRVK